MRARKEKGKGIMTDLLNECDGKVTREKEGKEINIWKG
jgi:hypothetical protein